jgi:hypothetical protein
VTRPPAILVCPNNTIRTMCHGRWVEQPGKLTPARAAGLAQATRIPWWGTGSSTLNSTSFEVEDQTGVELCNAKIGAKEHAGSPSASPVELAAAARKMSSPIGPKLVALASQWEARIWPVSWSVWSTAVWGAGSVVVRAVIQLRTGGGDRHRGLPGVG